MANVKSIEKQIWKVEGFDITIRHLDGRDVRSDKEDLLISM